MAQVTEITIDTNNFLYILERNHFYVGVKDGEIERMTQEIREGFLFLDSKWKKFSAFNKKTGEVTKIRDLPYRISE